MAGDAGPRTGGDAGPRTTGVSRRLMADNPKREHIIQAWQNLAEEVISTALRDLVRQTYATAVSQEMQDNAAEWFATDGHVTWCDLLEIDADAVADMAAHLAGQYRNHVEHPIIFDKPRITV